MFTRNFVLMTDLSVHALGLESVTL